jgi:hypothetical protein
MDTILDNLCWRIFTPTALLKVYTLAPRHEAWADD